MIRIFTGLPQQIDGAAFLPDGTTVVGISSDSSVRFWDRETGVEIRRWVGQYGEAAVFAFSPDGLQIAVSQGDGAVQLRPITDSAFANLACTYVFRDPPDLTAAELKEYAIVNKSSICDASQ
jgi:WD40 repeat protein